MAVTATLVGGPTVVLQYAGLTFLTDPTFDPPTVYGDLIKTRGPAVAVEDLPSIDVVLLSHDEHDDNLDRQGRTVVEATDIVLSTPSAAERMPGVEAMAPWETLAVDGPEARVVVTAVPAQHGPRLLRPILGEVTGFVLRAEGQPTVYVTGDNSSVKVGRRVAERFPDIELVFAFAGGAGVEPMPWVRLTMDARRVAAVARALPDASIVPVHVDDWAHFREQRDAFVAAWQRELPPERLAMLERGVTRTWA